MTLHRLWHACVDAAHADDTGEPCDSVKHASLAPLGSAAAAMQRTPKGTGRDERERETTHAIRIGVSARGRAPAGRTAASAPRVGPGETKRTWERPGRRPNRRRRRRRVNDEKKNLAVDDEETRRRSLTPRPISSPHERRSHPIHRTRTGARVPTYVYAYAYVCLLAHSLAVCIHQRTPQSTMTTSADVLPECRSERLHLLDDVVVPSKTSPKPRVSRPSAGFRWW